MRGGYALMAIDDRSRMEVAKMSSLASPYDGGESSTSKSAKLPVTGPREKPVYIGPSCKAEWRRIDPLHLEAKAGRGSFNAHLVSVATITSMIPNLRLEVPNHCLSRGFKSPSGGPTLRFQIVLCCSSSVSLPCYWKG